MQILTVVIHHSHRNDTSAVLNGCAVLTGALVPVELRVFRFDPGNAADHELIPHAPDWRPRVLGRCQKAFVGFEDVGAVEICLDRPRETTISWESAESTCWMRDPGWKNRRSNTDTERATFYCFRLFSWEPTGTNRWRPPKGAMLKKRPDARYTWFLVLGLSTTVTGAFERIGIGMSDHVANPFAGVETTTIKIV
jgi:hypothetical protein